MYTKVLTVGDHETYWGGAEGIKWLCWPLWPWHINYNGGHAKEYLYRQTIVDAMARLLDVVDIDQDWDMDSTGMSSDISSDISQSWSMSD